MKTRTLSASTTTDLDRQIGEAVRAYEKEVYRGDEHRVAFAPTVHFSTAFCHSNYGSTMNYSAMLVWT